MKLEDRIIKILKENLERSQEITLETRLSADLMLDSFDILMIISALEDEFSITVDEEVFRDIVTVNDIVVKFKAKYL